MGAAHMPAPRLIKTEAEMRAVLDDLRARANNWPTVRVQGPSVNGVDRGDYLIEARRWTSAKRRENPVRFYIDGDRASADTIVGMVVFDCDTLNTSGNRVVLRAPTLRAAIAKTEAA